MKRKYKARKTVQVQAHRNDHYMKNMRNTLGSMFTSCNAHPLNMQGYGVFDNEEERSIGVVFNAQDVRHLHKKLDAYGIMVVKEYIASVHGMHVENKHHKALIASLRLPEKQDEV